MTAERLTLAAAAMSRTDTASNPNSPHRRSAASRMFWRGSTGSTLRFARLGAEVVLELECLLGCIIDRYFAQHVPPNPRSRHYERKMPSNRLSVRATGIQCPNVAVTAD